MTLVDDLSGLPKIESTLVMPPFIRKGKPLFFNKPNKGAEK